MSDTIIFKAKSSDLELVKAMLNVANYYYDEYSINHNVSNFCFLDKKKRKAKFQTSAPNEDSWYFEDICLADIMPPNTVVIDDIEITKEGQKIFVVVIDEDVKIELKQEVIDFFKVIDKAGYDIEIGCLQFDSDDFDKISKAFKELKSK